ncbi:MAG TPA: CocE/NonD family hydrolase [Dongiaceae bacterium]
MAKNAAAALRKVREIENVFIPLKDGTNLAARIWLPVDAEKNPVPAILEYLPYRKRDGTAPRDALTHPWFAARGYAGVRVDIRGTGESDGAMMDEYLKLEQDDCLEALAWIAKQPWCTGKCGMIGISWGGFNGLQVAARRPPALKAVISLCSTDDRYADDVHYMGGALLVDNFSWASMMFSLQTYPPDPLLVGKRWRKMWLERLEKLPLLIDNWLKHQRRDAYWKHGSVCENYADITCAVYAVGGWADGYSNAVPRLLAGLKCPKKGLVGPWAHRYPHFADPGPRIGFLTECLRWWDQWLKDRDTGVMDEPAYRVWMQDWTPPKSGYAERPGRWVGEPSWPSPNVNPKNLALNEAGLAEKAEAGATLTVPNHLAIGLLAGHWCPYGVAPDQPSDQSVEDGQSLVFDSEPLSEAVEILGAPVVELAVSVDRPQAQLCVRLNDLAPDGSSLRVTFGMLNLTHHASHEKPEALKPGRTYRIQIRMNDIAQTFPKGHRIRLALSASYWPIVWPSPASANVGFVAGSGHLVLPVRAARKEDAKLPAFAKAETPTPLARTVHRPGWLREWIDHDLVSGTHVFTTEEDEGVVTIDHIDMTEEHHKAERFTITEGDPLSAIAEISHSHSFSRGTWKTRMDTWTRMTATASNFVLEGRLDAFEGENRVLSRNWHVLRPRDRV